MIRTLLAQVDGALNRITMYRLLVYTLAFLLAIAALFAVTGTIGISATGLLISTALLIFVSWGTNTAFRTALRVPANSESWLITALILACIMPPITSVRSAMSVGIAGVVAMASKYLIVWRGAHIFNPAAFGAVVVGLFGLASASWWIATPALAPIAGLIGLLILRKTRVLPLAVSFVLTSLLVMVLVSSYGYGQPVAQVLQNALLSWPLMFFGSIMLTEPATLPRTRYYQILFAAVVGAIFASQLHLGFVSTSPQVALVIGNLLALTMAVPQGFMLKLLRQTKLSESQYELVFEKPQRLQYRPGQFMEWTLPHAHGDARGNRRSFSLASSPTESEVRIGIKANDPSSSFKKALWTVLPGRRIRAAHVQGDFVLPESKRPLVYIAGGIGITPIRSHVQFLTDHDTHGTYSLLYVASNEVEHIYKEVFSAAERIGLTTQYLVGRIDYERLQSLVPLDTNAVYYVSGPDAFVRTYTRMLRSMQVPYTNIRTDHFSGY